MWNGGGRPGPRGGMPFRGEPRGGMFEGRDGPRPVFRGRDGMNMDRSPMDMRRFDCPPDMRGRDMGFNDRGREPSREFFRPGDEMDMNFRRRFEMDQRNNLQNSPGFTGPPRPPMDMSCRDMPGGNMRGPDDGFMNMRERDRFQMDMPGLPPVDIRRRLAMVAMGGNGDPGDMRDRERSRMGGIDGFNMDMPPRDRPMMDFDRRGVTPPLNPRGRFDSDMDLRNRMGPSNDFRDQPPPMFRDNDGVPMDMRGRPDMPLGRGGPESMIRADEMTLRDREFPEPMDSPIGFRGREGESLADEWRKHGIRDREPLPPMMGRTPPVFPRDMSEKFFPNHGRDVDLGEQPQFKDRDRQSGFLGKDGPGFNRPERDPKHQNWEKNITGEFPSRDSPQNPPLLPMDPSLNVQSRESDKPWPNDRDEKLDRTGPAGSRPPYFQDKNPPNQEHNFANDRVSFKGSSEIPSEPGPQRESLMSGPKETLGNRGERQDQDYRDIDYRTGSVRKYDYNIQDLQAPEKDEKEPKLGPAQRPDDSGSQDQDYRSAGVQDKVSKNIAISGIPKTATMQQILGAFAVRDGVPMQGMKIRDVVPGYSFDTAYVEFLNLEDAVHFMESNQGSVKVGDKTALLKYIQQDKNAKEPHHEPPTKPPANDDGLLPDPVLPLNTEETSAKPPDPPSQGVWQRSSNLTPEAWQQQVDQQLQQQEVEQQAEEWTNQRAARQNLQHSDPIFKESKTMIIKNILPTTTVETILQALDQFAYLDERNVRLVKGKSPGSKCFCFVDMDSHEHVTRLVELLTKPRPIMIDGVRVYAEVAKPLKNQNYRRDSEKSNTSLLGFPPDVSVQQQQQLPQQQFYPQPPHTAMGVSPAIQGNSVGADATLSSAAGPSSSLTQGMMYPETGAVAQPVQTAEHQTPALPDAAVPGAGDPIDGYSYGSEAPDLSAFLYDATSGFYYDPQTTLYYDPNSRYFYDAQNQQYLYWDSTSKTYIPVQSSSTDVQEPAPEVSVPVAAVAEVIATPITEEEVKLLPEVVPEVRGEEDPSPRAEKKEKEKEEKPRSLAAFKIMKDMERWAKIQNRQKETVRSPSPLLKAGGDDQRPSKAADAAFAIFERKATGSDELFKKPLAPPKAKEEKSSKRPMGSLGMLAADYGAGSDEEEEEKHEKQEAARPAKSQPSAEEREDRLTDWKKMACLLCRRQFPNKDALIRHQQLSDLHKQNMEIHLKIKRSKRELEALENQEKQMKVKDSNGSPEAKRRKPQNAWAGTSRDSHKGSERPGLGLETVERKKKEPVVWNHATYKQAVRKAMFARFNELD